jgi:hypothetical protein
MIPERLGVSELGYDCLKRAIDVVRIPPLSDVGDQAEKLGQVDPMPNAK